MSKKDNFNQAMFEMFGVGKENSRAVGENTAAASGEEAAAAEEQGENLLSFPASRGPELKVVSRPVTYLAPGTRLEGTLRAEGPVEIDGEFKGDILSEGSVTVRTDVTGNITARSLNIVSCCLTGDAQVAEQVVLNEGSSVNGNVRAGTLACAGTIIGDLDVQSNIALESNAKVVGNITTGTLTTARGAVIRGNLEIRGEDIDGE